MDGVKYRFCRKPPDADPHLIEELGNFVRKWLRKNLSPLSADSDCSFKNWLDNTNYPQWRKKQLDLVFTKTNGILQSEDLKVKSFIKDETYGSYKYPRAINSRSDAFKVRVGPIFKLIEKQLYKLKWFIKNVPVDERCQVIKNDCHQEGARVVGTDYTSFEALFVKILMVNCEMLLYDYMTQHLPDKDWFVIVLKAMTGINKCVFKNFSCLVEATRMSGEMCTSLGNGFSNLMIFKFVAKKTGLKSLKGKVEGDDGIFTYYGPKLDEYWFNKMGLLVKIIEYDDLCSGSFCGILCDHEEMINITDPIVALLDFGWANGKYYPANSKCLRALLRAKGMSLAYQYPGCPILNSLAKYALRITKDSAYKIDKDPYKTDLFKSMLLKYGNEFPVKSVGFRTRVLVEDRFKIPICVQIKFEQYLDRKNDLSPIEFGDLLPYLGHDARDYYDRYRVSPEL